MTVLPRCAAVAIMMLGIEAAGGDQCAHLSEEACLGVGGCRWFFWAGDCEHCQETVSKQFDLFSITGCRNWSPQLYCHHHIFEVAQHRSKAAPERWLKEALQRFHIKQGSGEDGNPHHKESTCSAWCDMHGERPCFGQPRALDEIRGVNYGGRFVPEEFLGLPGTREILFKGVQKPWGSKDISLCDVAFGDAGDRMAQFLDMNIKAEHFTQMAQLGFNIVRLPLGYWNLIDFPDTSTPNGPSEVAARFRSLQNLMPASAYKKWIDKVFKFAEAASLKVLMDLHTAPGGQSGNQNTGCDLGDDSVRFFVTDWNRHQGQAAIEAMARICAEQGSTCWGIELLNEPYGPHHDAHSLSRDTLKQFYADAIKAARRHLHKDKPLVVNDWPTWIESYWTHNRFSYKEYGHVIFSTHLYQYPEDWTTDQQQARDSFKKDLQRLMDFHLSTGSQIFVSEYALNSHGNGKVDDNFDYGAMTHWFVHQFNQHGLGSVIWNYDSVHEAWGPVQQHQRVGRKAIPWADIFNRRLGESEPTFI